MVIRLSGGVNSNNLPPLMFTIASGVSDLSIVTNTEDASLISRTIRESGLRHSIVDGTFFIHGFSAAQITIANAFTVDGTAQATDAVAVIHDEPTPVPETEPDAALELTPELEPEPEPEPEPAQIVPAIPTASLDRESGLDMLRPLFEIGDRIQTNITMYLSKVLELNRMYGSMISLKRKIEQMMKIISQDEMVTKFFNDIDYLRQKCDLISDVSLSSDKSLLCVTTKELVTEDLGRGHGKRVVGRMQIIINPKYIYSLNPPDNAYVESINFINLDRSINNDGLWVCGHAYHVNTQSRRVSACYGGYSEHLMQAFVSRDLPALIDTLIRFIRNPNVTDAWGCKILDFPRPEDLNETR